MADPNTTPAKRRKTKSKSYSAGNASTSTDATDAPDAPRTTADMVKVALNLDFDVRMADNDQLRPPGCWKLWMGSARQFERHVIG